MGSVTARRFSLVDGRMADRRRRGRRRAVLLPQDGPEAEQNRATAIFVADRGQGPMHVAEAAPMIHEIVLLPLETPKREHSIEACALVAHRDQGALAGQHNL